MSKYVWRPVHRPEDHAWSVARYHRVSDELMEWSLGKDGQPIRFWGTPQAQMHADAKNRREV